jgi:hypothetical protein
MHALGAKRRIMAKDVTDLPEPDSPTIPQMVPLSILKEMFLIDVVIP